MTTIETRARVGPDGIIELRVPVGVCDAGLEVKIVVTPLDSAGQPQKMSRDEWLAFLDRTAGSIDDPTFERPPQAEIGKPGDLE